DLPPVGRPAAARAHRPRPRARAAPAHPRRAARGHGPGVPGAVRPRARSPQGARRGRPHRAARAGPHRTSHRHVGGAGARLRDPCGPAPAGRRRPRAARTRPRAPARGRSPRPSRRHPAGGPAMSLLSDPLVQRMLLVGVLVGVATPIVGTCLVQRRMALLGDGIGHVALAGVAAGWLAGSAADLVQRDALAVPGAIVFAVAAAVVMERMRARGAAADVVLAVLFYGGIATGVLLISAAGGSSANLLGYLFGSISTVTWPDVWVTVALAGLIIAAGLGLRPALFAVTHDEEFARASGLPVRLLTTLVAI